MKRGGLTQIWPLPPTRKEGYVMDSNRALLFGGVALAVLLGIFSLSFAAWAAFDDRDHSPANGWWGPGMMTNPGMMGPMMGS